MELPDKAGLAAIVERYARLLERVGSEAGERALVLPNADFFPDRFTPDEASVATLVDRMMAHAGLADIPLTTRVVAEDGPEAPHSGCSSGCAVPGAVAGSQPRLTESGDAWTLHVPATEVAHSVVLTTMIARALAHVFLVETLPGGVPPEAPAELTADYAAVLLGFGPILLEGAYIYSKGCGGPSVAQVTRASLPELAVLSALFVEIGGHPARRALRELGTTQAALFAEAHEWAKSNGPLVARLRTDPGSVAARDYTLSDSKPWLLRLFGKKAPPPDSAALPDFAVAPTAAQRAKPRDPAHDELRALVDEALGARADAQ
jgi:hypothetical protein